MENITPSCWKAGAFWYVVEGFSFFLAESKRIGDKPIEPQKKTFMLSKSILSSACIVDIFPLRVLTGLHLFYIHGWPHLTYLVFVSGLVARLKVKEPRQVSYKFVLE